MDKLKNLILSRAMLVAFASAVVVLLRKSGIGAPEDLERAIGDVIDTGLIALGAYFAVNMSNGKPPSEPPSGGTVTRITLPSPRDSGAPPLGAAFVALAIVLLLSGCQALRTANDFRNGLCSVLGSEREAELDAEAARVGMSPAEMLEVWRATCLVRIEAAEREAVGAIGGAR